MDETRHRNARRACEPCRRKKVKCPGERPICSFCRRLGQPCDYSFNEPDLAQIPQDRRIEQRMGTIEGKLDLLIQSLKQDQPKAKTHSTDPSISSLPPGYSEDLPDAPQSSQDQTDGGFMTLHSEDQSLLEAGQLFQSWCHNQPLSLFRQEGFLESLQNRDYELCLAIQALSCRFPPGSLTPEKQLAINGTVKVCRKMVMDRVANKTVKLSTLQTLCLLNMISSADGDMMQAGFDLSMAHYLASSLPPGASLGDPAEFSLCIHGISLLQNIQGCISDGKHVLRPFNNRSSIQSSLRDPGHDVNPSSGILPYIAQVAEAWQMARVYAASHVGTDGPPPWDPQSDYSLIMLRHMELDCQYPVKYRFATSNFGGLTPEALQRRRDYWGPWLFHQFIYSAVPALVNHPFLLSMRLKGFRRMMPQTFIYQSFDQISRHSTWIICFIDLVEKQQFQVSDPVVAHCVAIVATIHLQHSFARDDVLRQKAQKGYEKCMSFLDRMGLIWPCVASMAQNLRKLQDSITMIPSVSGQDTQTSDPQMSWSIDAQLLWDILIYEKAVCSNAAADKSLFGEPIILETYQPEQDISEFAMVGSAGISGHKTVPKEVTAYAPEDNRGDIGINPLSTPAGAMAGGLNVADHRFFESFEDMNQMMGGDNSFLQAEDWGKAIDNWFNFDMS